MYVVAVEFMVKPGQLDAFRPVMLRQAQNSLEREPGCLQFDVYADVRNPLRICLYEIYRDEAAFAEHRRMPHFAEFDAAVQPLIDSKVVTLGHRLWPAA